ncbi:sensor histidine kinase [Sphingomonas palmae]|nr:HAMP domain-containing sensor histidine kinase [Sphingomonas palmae]
MLSVATTASIVVLAPPPPTLRMSAAEAIGALSRPGAAFEREMVELPSQGTRVPNLEELIAAELRLDPRSVRVTWLENIQPLVGLDPKGGKQAANDRENPLGGRTLVFRSRKNGLFEMLDPNVRSAEYRRSAVQMTRPAFVLSVRRNSGNWISVQPTRPFLTGWQRNMLVSLAVTLLLLVPLAWVFARRMTRPFRVLAGALGDQDDVVPEAGPRELREAAAAIGAMRDRLSREATERARMLTAIAHDLRTPMTGLRLRVESSPEPQRARMIADLDRMQSMIGEVLTFAREAATPIETIDVRPTLVTVLADMHGQGESLRLLSGDEANVSVSPPGFRRAIENLLQNAVDYAGGGTIAIERDGAEVCISVADTGPGIAVVDRARLLRPFERGESSRNRQTGGVGLGLSIVSDFANRHKGSFTLAEAPGGGTLAILTLPAARL